MIRGHRVSLLVSSRNRSRLLADAVQSVLRGSTVPDEIVIIDQSDEADSLLPNLTHPCVDIAYIHSDTVGISRSRNLAFSRATHPIIVIIDDDCLVSPTWLQTIVSALLDSGARTVITGRVLAGDTEGEGTFAPSLHESSRPAEYVGRIGTDPLATFNFALHASTYAEIGEFDTRIGPGTRFPSAEDNDYGYRLLKSGYRIVFQPDAVVYHRAWRTKGRYISIRYAYGRGQGGYYGKHLAARDWYMLVKLRYALERRLGQMRHGGTLGLLGELAWIGGWFSGVGDWLFRPSRRSETATRSRDGSRGW
ncbi:glycosyltransferase family 2 protein [Promicromonospora sp. NFX87]|uniref:glycosyltransferase family 2 protein n=1 Tax=Promicromonospora sp. NFX87 TaxID=3402691 RepID=UPI003AFB180D